MTRVFYIFFCIGLLISMGYGAIETRVIQVVDETLWNSPSRLLINVQVRHDRETLQAMSAWQYSFTIADGSAIQDLQFSAPAFNDHDYQIYHGFRREDGRIALAVSHRSGAVLQCGDQWMTLIQLSIVYEITEQGIELRQNRVSPHPLALDADGHSITGRIESLPRLRNMQRMTCQLKRGWQLISLPGLATSMQVSDLFPNSIGGMAFDWKGSAYYPVETLVPGRGYWIAQNKAEEITLELFTQPSFQRIFYERGWFLIGGSNEQTDFSAPNVNPSGSIFPPAYGYDNANQRYRGATLLQPMSGYWIAVLNPCELVIETGGVLYKRRIDRKIKQSFIEEFGSHPPAPPAFNTEILSDLDSDHPSVFQLLQNYPNPFNPSTTLPFFMRKRARVRIGIYNVKGQFVRTLLERQMSPGLHKISWNGKDANGQRVGAGIYLCKMQGDGFLDVKKLLLVH